MTVQLLTPIEFLEYLANLVSQVNEADIFDVPTTTTTDIDDDFGYLLQIITLAEIRFRHYENLSGK